MSSEAEVQEGEAPAAGLVDQDTGEEVANHGGDHEAGTEEYESASENVDYRQELQNLQGQYNGLTQQLSQLTSIVKQSALNNQAPPVPEGPTVEELQKLYEQNPVAAMKIMTEQQVKSAVNEATREISKTYKRESGQTHWDSKAEKDFPMLKSDPEFQAAVRGKIQELTSDGEYSNESPKLLYRAAQLAKASLGEKFYKGKSTKTVANAGTHGGVGAPRTAKKGSKVDIADDDPEIRMYVALGGTDVDKRKKDLAKERADKRRAK